MNLTRIKSIFSYVLYLTKYALRITTLSCFFGYPKIPNYSLARFCDSMEKAITKPRVDAFFESSAVFFALLNDHAHADV